MLKRLTAGLFLVAAISLVSLTCSSPEDDEIAVRRLIKEAAVLAEQHDIGGIMDLTTEDFQAGPGKLDRREVKRILWLAFKHYGDMKVLYPQPSVDLDPGDDGPSVSTPFLIVKKDQSLPGLGELYDDPKGWVERVGERADLYRFKLNLVKADGRWRVRKARLERFSGLGFRS